MHPSVPPLVSSARIDCKPDHIGSSCVCQDWVGGTPKVTKYFELPEFQTEIYRSLNHMAHNMDEDEMLEDYRNHFEVRRSRPPRATEPESEQ